MTQGTGVQTRLGSSRARAVWVLVCAIGTIALMAAAACGDVIVPPKEPDSCKLQVVDMTILASQRLNPTDLGEPRPVITRVYQLSSDTRLNNADFTNVWKDDKKAFGEDLLKVQEFPVYPDSRTDVRFERDPNALVIAVVALFRSPKGRSWYTVIELPPPPGKGNCYLKVCKGGQCKDAGPDLNPRFVIWMDGTRVDVGDDRLEDYPTPGRYQRAVPNTEKPAPEDGPGRDKRGDKPAGKPTGDTP